MKALRKSFIALAAVLLMLSIMTTGCSNTSQTSVNDGEDKKKEPVETTEKESIETAEAEPVESLEAEPTESSQEKPLPKTRAKIIDPFLAQFPPDATAADLGNYIKDNIVSASKEEADNMMAWLMIYQDDMVPILNEKLWEDEYYNIIINDMNGALDKSKIDNIQNDEIRAYFVSVINSFLTIDSFDQQIYIEINWEDLLKYSAYTTDDFREVIRLSKKNDDYAYENDDLEVDVNGLSKDIILLEELINNNQSAFIRWKAAEVWRTLTCYLLLGPENVYIFHYDGKNSQEYKEIMKLTTKYPDSKLARAIAKLDLITDDDISSAINGIQQQLQFGLSSDNYLEVRLLEEPNGEYELLEVHMPSDIEKQNQMNRMILIKTEEYIQSLVKEDQTFQLRIESDFQNKRYISYVMLLKMTDSEGNETYSESYLTLDYLKEKFITLEEYFDADFSFIQEYVEETLDVKAESIPEFQLTSFGMLLCIDKGTDHPNYLYLRLKDLLQYFTLEELIGND